MSLSSDLISQFVKATNDGKETKHETTVYATVVESDGRKYVQIDGSELLTPVSTTADSKAGDRVIVMIKNHTAMITGNISSPSATSDNVVEMGTLIAKKVSTVEFEAAQADIKVLQADTVNITERLTVNEADIETLKATSFDAINANIEQLKATDVEITGRLEAAEGHIENLGAVDLTALNAEIETLKANDANINTLIFGSATGTAIQTSFANAIIALLGDAQIKSAMIESVAADKILAGDIITNNVRVVSEDGKLLISDETIQISDDTRVRVQIGKDAADDYSINIWDADGNLMFSEGGITDSAIKEAIIRNDMVSEDANISASKLDIDSLFTEINGSANTIKSTRVYLDDKKQSLDVAFKEMESDVTEQGNKITSQGTQISAIQGQITNKVWQQDIDTAAGEMETRYSSLEQDLDGISTTVASHTSQIDNISIGGRNLIRDSKLNKDTNMWDIEYDRQQTSFENGYLEISRVADNNSSRTFITQSSSANPLILPDNINGKTYVLSADMKAIEGFDSNIHSSLFWRVYYDEGDTYEELSIPIPVDLSATEWRRCYSVKTFGNRNWRGANLTIALASGKNGVCLRNVMLEQATKPSNWTPAPEDVETQVSETKSRITQLSDRVTSNVTEIDGLSSRMSEVEQTADGLTVKLENVKYQKYHEACGTNGVTGYVGFCTLTVTGNYVNAPIMFTLSNRGQQSTNVAFCLRSINNTDPALYYIQCDGDMNIWAYKSGVSTWIIIAQKSEAYDTIYINDFANPRSGVTAAWTNIHYDSLPTENITQATRLAGKLTKSTVDNAAKTATNYLGFSSKGLVVGDMTASTLGKNVLIDSDSVDIRNGGTVLSSFGADTIELGKNTSDAVIKMCAGKGQIEYTTDDDDYLQMSADKLRLKSSEMSSLYSTYTNNSTRWEKSAVNVTPTEISMYASECIDPTMVEKVEGWNTSEFDMSGTDISASADVVSITGRDGVFLQTDNGVAVINGMVFGMNQALWSGTYYMNESQTITLSQPVSAQKNGIVLVWSYYENGVAKDHSFNSHFVSKYEVAVKPGCPHTFLMAINAGLSTFGAKYVYISDTKLAGHVTNATSGTADSGIKFSNDKYVLRYVIGV